MLTTPTGSSGLRSELDNASGIALDVATLQIIQVDWIDPASPHQLSNCDPASARTASFESGLPVRVPGAHKGQRNISGFVWSAKAGRSLFFESRLEMQHLLRLERDRSVVSMSTQPFRVAYEYGESNTIGVSVPDIFCRMTDGAGRVIECKRAEALKRSATASRVARAWAACESLGFSYEVATELPPVFASNLRWLAGFRRTPADFERISELILQRLDHGAATIRELVDIAEPALSKPVVFSMLWSQHIYTDLSALLTLNSVVTLGWLQ